MEYILFAHRHIGDTVKAIVETTDEEFEIKTHKLKLGSGLYLPGENKNLMSTLVRLEFYLMGKGKTELYYCVNKDNKIIHKSTVFPACWKFPFLKKDDYCIGGPCVTDSAYRGKNIYPQVLRYIMSKCGNSETRFYMVVNRTNEPSIRGVEKAGFQSDGKVYVTRLKQYKRA